MPVVNKKSDLFGADADPAKARGRPITTTFTVANAADDSSLSTFLLARLPSEAILDSRTAFQVQNWGFATVNIGTLTDIDALGTVAKSAGNVYSPVAFGDARHGLPLWEALGLAANPGGEIEIYAHASANATGAGSMKGEFHYRFR
jgi:hypothetical protein